MRCIATISCHSVRVVVYVKCSPSGTQRPLMIVFSVYGQYQCSLEVRCRCRVVGGSCIVTVKLSGKIWIMTVARTVGKNWSACSLWGRLVNGHSFRQWKKYSMTTLLSKTYKRRVSIYFEPCLDRSFIDSLSLLRLLGHPRRVHGTLQGSAAVAGSYTPDLLVSLQCHRDKGRLRLTGTRRDKALFECHLGNRSWSHSPQFNDTYNITRDRCG